MKISQNKILTSHVGSLPRPNDLLQMLEAKESGDNYDIEQFEKTVAKSIEKIVLKQKESGIDVLNDGENSKISYTFYVKNRLGGVGLGKPDNTSESVVHADLVDFPDFAQKLKERQAKTATSWFKRAGVPICDGPVSYKNITPLHRDIKNLNEAKAKHGALDVFMNSASPGVLTKFVPDHFYHDEDKYIEVLAEALKVEYEKIHEAGIILQIDAPDLGSARHNQYKKLSEKEYLKIAERNIEALNYATQNIPCEAMRMHICWGNYEGPHTHDIPLSKVLPVAFKARPAGILFEGANPRHAHEWEDLLDIKIPDDKILIPGVIDTTTNFVEHPKLIAQRICNFAKLVDKERIIAGTDCGFATFAGPNNAIAQSVVWAKLNSLSEGASIATQRLWKS